jgi:hypothetical protein
MESSTNVNVLCHWEIFRIILDMPIYYHYVTTR